MSALAPITGTANNLTELLAALNSALTGNGYTYNGINKTLSKGTVASAITIVGAGSSQVMQMQAGTGVDGSGILQNPSPRTPRIRAGLTGSNKDVTVTFPVIYTVFIYTNPDMWVLVVNHDTAFYQYMMNGNAINHGHTGIGGVVPFFYATYSDFDITTRSTNGVNMRDSLSGGGAGGYNAALPFFMSNQRADGDNCGAFINEPVDFQGTMALTWSPNSVGNYPLGGQSSWNNNNVLSNRAIIARLPNRWNNDSQLVPITVQAVRPAGFFSQGFEIPHLRMMRNDYYNDGDIIHYGPDSWITLSARKKNTVQRTATQDSTDHSGTYAFAFEYVAP